MLVYCLSLIISVENSYFCGNHDTFALFFDEQKVQRTLFIKRKKVFCNIIQTFTATFDQLNASLLWMEKSINILIDLKLEIGNI